MLLVPSHPDPTPKHRSDLLRLVCALCVADRATARALIEDRKGALDWQSLVAIAREFRLAMLLHRAVSTFLADLASPAAFQTLRKLCADNQALAASMTAELRHALDRFAAEDIPALPYKGPVFGAQLHGDPALRVFADLDVLVRACDVDRATRLLLADGYQAGDRLGWEMSFTRGEHEGIDLHWSIAEDVHQFPRTPEEIWADRTTVVLAGAPVPALCAQDTLLALCFNGMSEDWQRFDRIADVAAVVRAGGVGDWPGLLALCRERGCERIVLLGLHLAKALFLVTLPAVVEERLQAHAQAIARAGYAIDSFMHFAVTSTDRRGGMDALRFLVRMRERQREKLPYYQSIAYRLFKPRADDAPWVRKSRQAVYTVLRLPLLGVKHALIAAGHSTLKDPDPRH